MALGYWGHDLEGARAYQRGAEDAARWVHDQRSGKGWFAGHWGFQYYAECAGLTPIIHAYQPPSGRIEFPPASQLVAGDWVVVPEAPIHRQAFQLDSAQFQPFHEIAIGSISPMRVTPCFYDGRSPLCTRRGPDDARDDLPRQSRRHTASVAIIALVPDYLT